MKIGLGTAQFGMDYGISNREGQTSTDEVVRILEVARQNRISVIDTAALYGASEEVLGRTLPRDHEFRLVTKTIRIDVDRITGEDADRMEQAFFSSLEKLSGCGVYGLLFHNTDDLLAEGGELLLERMEALRHTGRIEKIGVSVYTAEQLDAILELMEPDIVQLPMNVLDQRLLAGGRLAALKSRNIEIHVRSAFLQGLLLMDPESLPDFFASARRHLEGYHAFLRENSITPVRAALGFLAGRFEIDCIVCGVNNHRQLMELCRSAAPLPDIDFSTFALDDATLLNPSCWGVA